MCNREFRSLFNGIRPVGATLRVNFYLPLWREFCLATGTIACDKQAIKRTLETTQGTCLAIVVGGAREFFCMRRGTQFLT